MLVQAFVIIRPDHCNSLPNSVLFKWMMDCNEKSTIEIEVKLLEAIISAFKLYILLIC